MIQRQHERGCHAETFAPHSRRAASPRPRPILQIGHADRSYAAAAVSMQKNPEQLPWFRLRVVCLQKGFYVEHLLISNSRLA
jgi:hypothetical protein